MSRKTSCLVALLLTSLAAGGCSGDDRKTEEQKAEEANAVMNANTGTGPSMLGTMVGAAVGAAAGSMIGNKMAQDRQDDKDYRGGASSGGSTAGARSTRFGGGTTTGTTMPKANVVSRGSSFGGMGAGS